MRPLYKTNINIGKTTPDVKGEENLNPCRYGVVKSVTISLYSLQTVKTKYRNFYYNK